VVPILFGKKMHDTLSDLLDFFDILQIESNICRCPDPEYAEKMIAAIDKVRTDGNSIGGVVTCIARNVPRVSITVLSCFCCIPPL
jgi:chorismate synthase